jgi:quinol monooxygenase YgiN
MATMIVKHRVKNFETWKGVFDSMESARKQHGWLGAAVFRDAADPNLVTVINKVRTLDGAKAYGGSPDLRAAMAKGGVDGPPEIHFLDDVEDRTY